MSPRPATKKSAKSSKVAVKRKPLAERLHPGILAEALQYADGRASRVEVVTYTQANVTVPTARPGTARLS